MLDAAYDHALDRHGPACWSQTKQLAFVRTISAPPGCHAIPGAELLQDGGMQVGEGAPVSGDVFFYSLYANIHVGRNCLVLDVIGGKYLGGYDGVSLVPALFDPTAD
jgi:hypothetical protein